MKTRVLVGLYVVIARPLHAWGKAGLSRETQKGKVKCSGPGLAADPAGHIPWSWGHLLR